MVAQLRFPTILKIGVEPPAAFQERIRRDYPIYSTESGINIPAEMGAMPQEILNLLQRGGGGLSHRFDSEDQMRHISLASDRMAFQDRAYIRWEQFLSELEKAEQALRDVFEPAFYSRIGLRYQDLFRRSRLGLDERPWQELLMPHVLGLMADSDVSENVLESTGAAMLSIEDVEGARARVQYGVQSVDNEPCFRLDVDVFTTGRTKPNDAITVFQHFSGVARGIFRHVIADTLHSAMGPNRIQ